MFLKWPHRPVVRASQLPQFHIFAGRETESQRVYTAVCGLPARGAEPGFGPGLDDSTVLSHNSGPAWGILLPRSPPHSCSPKSNLQGPTWKDQTLFWLVEEA